MKKVKIFLLLVITFLAAGFIITSCKPSANGVAPIPGASGAVTISGIGADSLTLTWEKAKDDATTPENLEYLAYYATVSSINTPGDVQANAVPVGDWERDIAARKVMGLKEATDYYFAVLVRDGEGNMAAYEPVAVFAVNITFVNVPSSAQSITLTVAGTGMEEINKTLTASATTVVTVPSGSAREFSAESGTASVSSKGVTETDLLTVDDKNVTVTLDISETKLVIPDAGNYRILQMDDMTGAGWTVLTWSDLGFSNDYMFKPYDIDFDSKGRIYIANSYIGATSTGVLRIDDINATSYDTIVSKANYGVQAITIDRTNDYIYYSDGSSPINRKTLDPLGSEESFSMQNEPAIGNFATNGMSSDQNGTVFIANTMEPNIVKYDPSKPEGSRIVNTYTYADLNSPWGVLVKGNYLYAADISNSGSNSPIVRFNIDNPAQYTQYGSFGFGTNPGDFYGPHVFAAILNKKLYLTDDDGGFSQKFIAIDDITGTGWETYGTYGSGQGQFKFFSSC